MISILFDDVFSKVLLILSPIIFVLGVIAVADKIINLIKDLFSDGVRNKRRTL